MTDWDDPRFIRELRGIIDERVKELVAKALPNKSYGEVLEIIGGTATVLKDGRDQATPGIWTGDTQVVERDPVTGERGSRVRVISWPDNDSYIDAAGEPLDIPIPGALPDPGIPVVSLGDDAIVSQDGIVVSSILVTWTAAPGEVTYYEIQVDDEDTFSEPRSYTTSALQVRVQPVTAYVQLFVRVRAFGNYETPPDWSVVKTITPTGDPMSPDVPDDLKTTPGFKLIALSWPRISEADLGRYGVRWTEDLAGVPDPDGWVNMVTLSNMVIIQDLTPGQKYWFEVRAVDRSGQTRVSATDATTVLADSPGNEEAGWSDAISGIPSKVGTADIAANSITSTMIAAGAITADMIKTGTLTVGAAGQAPSIEVRNASGALLARWNDQGLLMLDPNASDQALWMTAGMLKVTNSYNPAIALGSNTWTNSITADGINASGITFGINPGGHNNLPNSGFELTPFIVLASKLWTSAADWATGTNGVNGDVSGTELKLTTFAY